MSIAPLSLTQGFPPLFTCLPLPVPFWAPQVPFILPSALPLCVAVSSLLSSLLPTLAPTSPAASAFSPSLQPPPPTQADPRGASRMTGGRLRPVAPAGGGRGAGEGRFLPFPGPTGGGGPPADLRQLRRRPNAGECREAHARPRILWSASAVRASRLRPAIRSRKSEPCQASVWQIGLLSSPGVLSSMEATPSLWAQNGPKRTESF